MTAAAAGGRPVRFFAIMLASWVALRLGSFANLPHAPAPADPSSAVTPPTLVALAPASILTRSVTAATFTSASAVVPIPYRPRPAAAHAAPVPNGADLPTGRGAEAENGVAIDLVNFIRFTVGFADQHDAGMDGAGMTVPPLASPPLASPLLRSVEPMTDRWRGSAWLLWRPGSTSSVDLATVGRLGGSQAGARLDFDLTPAAAGRMAAYARITSALERPAAPEAAAGLSYQPVRAIPVSLAAEQRGALDKDARNATAVMLVGGFGPTPVAGPIEASGYAQAGMVGLHARDLFIDGKMSLLTPIAHGPLRIGASLSGGAQPQVERLDIGPELQIRLPLSRIATRIAVEWRERIAGRAAPASGVALTLAADF